MSENHEDAPLTPRQKETLWRLFFGVVVGGGSAVYLSFQLAHEGELLPEFLDADVFETQLWKLVSVSLGAALLTALFGGSRKDTTPDP